MEDQGPRLGNYVSVTAWGLDFARALNERPRLVRWLIQRLMGRYARRELRGMEAQLAKMGFDPQFDYDLKSASYHEGAK